METILHRIEKIAQNEGIKITSFEKSIGASKGVLSRAIKNGTDIQSKWLQAVVENYPHYSEAWILSGRGEMLKVANASVVSEPELIYSATPKINSKTTHFKEDSKEVPSINYEYKGAPYYNVDFIGGFDLVYNDQTITPDYYINFEPYNKPGVVWCNITGHSMEPELNNGDFIAMKEMTDPIEYLPFGEIYGIITDSYRTIKRMRLSDREGFVHLIPTNQSPEFKAQDIPISMVRKVYAVLGSMHRLF